MLKKYIVLLTVAFIFCAAVPPVYAGGDRLMAGVYELVSAPAQIPLDVIRHMEEEDNKLVGFFAGLIDGPAHTCYNIVSGIFKILTFPIDADF